MKIKMFTMIACIALLVMAFAGCNEVNQNETSESSEIAVTTTTVATTLSDARLTDVVSGVGDRLVLQNAANVDYMIGVAYDETKVIAVVVDDSKVDYGKTGEYDLVYHFTTEKDGVVDLNCKVRIVAEDEAAKLAEQGSVIYTGGDESYVVTTKKQAGTTTVKKNAAKTTAKASAKTTVKASAKTTVKQTAKTSVKQTVKTTAKQVAKTTAKPVVKTTAKPVAKTTAKRETVTPKTTAAHVHKWTPVYKEWDEEVTTFVEEVHTICRTCGFDFTLNEYTSKQVIAHEKEHALAGHDKGYGDEWVEIPCTETVHHKDLVGYKCSCGATK